MENKIIYILTMAVITIAAFFIGRNTVIMQCQESKTENTNIETIENALSQIEYIEVNDNGFDFYTFDGNIYEWR